MHPFQTKKHAFHPSLMVGQAELTNFAVAPLAAAKMIVRWTRPASTSSPACSSSRTAGLLPKTIVEW